MSSNSSSISRTPSSSSSSQSPSSTDIHLADSSSNAPASSPPPASSNGTPTSTQAPPPPPPPPPPNSSGGSVPPSSSSQPPTSSPSGSSEVPSTSVVTTVIQTSFITTNAQGSTVLVTALSTSVATQTGLVPLKTPSSHIAAIAGGAVGGVAGLILLLALGWCITRRRRRNDFDGDFDPDNVGNFQHGRQSLVPDGPTGAEVTPYTFGDNAATSGGYAPQMAEHNGLGAAAAGLGLGAVAGAAMNQHSRSGSRHLSGGSSEFTQGDGSYLPNTYGSQYQQPHDLAAASPISPNAVSTSSSEYSHPTTGLASQPRSAKEREAYAQRYGNASNTPGASGSLHLATMSPEDDDRSSNVLVHQDGGRFTDREPIISPSEIPPTYDSLPHEERP